MSEINARWARDHRNLQKLTGAGILASATLWLLSFYASVPASLGGTAHEAWFAFASMVTFTGAVCLTIGSGIGVSTLLTDDPPMNGDNR